MNEMLPTQTQAGKSHPRKIKKIIIYPKFQLLLISVNFLVTLLIFGLMCFIEVQAFQRFREIGEQIHLPPSHPYYLFLGIQGVRLLGGIALALFLGLLVSSVVMLVLSHRLAGPIVRLRGYFSEIAREGKVCYPLKFRKRDFFSELPDQINEALDSLNSPADRR